VNVQLSNWRCDTVNRTKNIRFDTCTKLIAYDFNKFWKLLKSITRRLLGLNLLIHAVDGASREDDASKMWYNNFYQLYNSVTDDGAEDILKIV